MSQLKYRRSKGLPSIYDLGTQLDASMADEVERERNDWYKRQLIHSDEPIDKLAIKAVAAGLADYVQVEDLEYSSWYRHKQGWFGHTTDEEGNTKRIKRVVVER